MTGANMVPPVNTPANGTTVLDFQGSKDNTLDYVVTVYDLVRPHCCQMHCNDADMQSSLLHVASVALSFDTMHVAATT